MSRRPFAAAGLLALALLGAACSSTQEAAQPTRTVPRGSQAPTTAGTVVPKNCVAATDVPTAAGKPTVDVPVGPAPTELVTTDILIGDGPEVKAGDKLSVQYVGVACTTGKQFDSSWDRGQPFDVTIGQGQVIPGWDQGIPGMKAGGRRMLVIPSDLAYGASGQGSGIGPNEPLIFVVDVVSVNGTTGTGTPAPSTTTTSGATATPTTAATSTSTP